MLREREAVEADGKHQRRDDERAQEVAYPPALDSEPESRAAQGFNAA